ncbi:Bifunctional transcriptional activator/DNA repair enzyme AdaA [Pseudovibrio axinellae]|uniref:Bifunctional transcriptional activator/DNA repair enzyme AdaA n=1 Tax=Pseudovibrio axinellae TaxID=989403 RepID=A0A165T606_9HYPH|nr:Ada metal-binding domain-containing protein [Pseudovibrio axinellae]KZL05486.1 Bifunctional transcriptional activator/DNA repair enzyme AdaA [Pseudovibrio axinellae]SEP97212.1 transcriptional regulator, AraC family [Pseudovibrio axinellae]
MIDFQRCEKARLSRDPCFDGIFFVGVKTSRIYCRTVCPVRQPLTKNVVYFPSAPAAEAANYRPCLRCRPEAAPNSPAWNGTLTSVQRALKLIDSGALDNGSVSQLAEKLGIGERHLSRLFKQHIGASPLQSARTVRLQRAKRLLDSSNAKISEIAYQAGFGSVRQFNALFLETYRHSPTQYRNKFSKAGTK